MDQDQAKVQASFFIHQLHQLEDGDNGAIDSLVDLFADNAHLSNPLIEREGRERIGRDEIAAFWRTYRATFGSIHSDFFDVTASDHAAGLFWRSAGIGPLGQPLDYEGVTLLEFDDDGKIARFRGYFDSEKVRLPSRAH